MDDMTAMEREWMERAADWEQRALYFAQKSDAYADALRGLIAHLIEVYPEGFDGDLGLALTKGVRMFPPMVHPDGFTYREKFKVYRPVPLVEFKALSE